MVLDWVDHHGSGFKRIAMPKRSPDIMVWDFTGFSYAREMLEKRLKKIPAPRWPVKKFEKILKEVFNSPALHRRMENTLKTFPTRLMEPDFPDVVR